MRYRDAGVDIARSDAIKDEILREVRATWGPQVEPLVSGFAGVMQFPGGGLLAASMDGVGTKLHMAMAAHRVDDAAADLVYHGANDLLVHGARPLAFLDYIAQSRLDPEIVLAVVRGLSRACREVGAVLLGGETAEMPDTYVAGVVDVAGCMIGHVTRERLLDGSRVHAGDRVLGLGSAGLHTNGFSLARRVLAASGETLAGPLRSGGGPSIGEALLAPHRWYGPALEPLLVAGEIAALAHVTGGGIEGNLVRVLPQGACARITPGWPLPPVFAWLIERGGVPVEDARTTLNMGIGMIAVVRPERSDAVRDALARAGEVVVELGSVVNGPRAVEWIEPT